MGEGIFWIGVGEGSFTKQMARKLFPQVFAAAAQGAAHGAWAKRQSVHSFSENPHLRSTGYDIR